MAAPGGLIIWFTGLSASGKTTLCEAVATVLSARGILPEVLDGDIIRQTISRDLGFSRADRIENVRRIGALAFASAAAGSVVLVAAISPHRRLRDTLRSISPVPFLEVFVDAPLPVCEQRDPKGLYRRARAGTLPGFTGIDDLYEPPEKPDVHCLTAKESIQESCTKIMILLDSLMPEPQPQAGPSAPLPGASRQVVDAPQQSPAASR